MIFEILVCLIILVTLYLIRKIFNGPFNHITTELHWKNVVITGSSSGIGKETALDLLDKGANVIFACRDEKKTKAIISQIDNPEVRDRASFMKLDLCSLESVNNFTKELKKRINTIDILINNAGILADNFNLTQDEIEESLQANHIGHMVLTFLLLNFMNKEESRIINVSSAAHRGATYTVEEIIRLKNNLEFKGEGDNYSLKKAMSQYGNTKLANIFFTQYLSDILRVKFQNIKTACLHPGVVNTEFARFIDNFNFLIRLIYIFIIYPIFWFFTKSSVAGAQTTLYLSYIDLDALENGEYYENCKKKETAEIAKDVNLKNEVISYSWLLIDKATKDKFVVPRYD